MDTHNHKLSSANHVSVADFQIPTQNFTLTLCSTLTLNMIPTENKNAIHFKERKSGYFIATPHTYIIHACMNIHECACALCTHSFICSFISWIPKCVTNNIRCGKYNRYTNANNFYSVKCL
jgi:hypothetical protein